MSDLENMAFLKLRPVNDTRITEQVRPLLCDGERILQQYQGIRDAILFTDRRVIAVNTQGITGKKKDITSMPYSKIQTYSVETSGVFDLDAELSLYFSTIGKIRFEFSGSCDMARICRIISNYVL